VPNSQQYLFNAIPDTNHNANPTNPNHNSKGNPNPNTTYRWEYGSLNSKHYRYQSRIF